MNFKKGLLLISFISLFSTGCAKYNCEPGSNYNELYDKCIVTANGDLKAVVQSKECSNDGKCTGTILDERNRKIKIDLEKNINVGDQISIVLYKDKKEVK